MKKAIFTLALLTAITLINCGSEKKDQMNDYYECDYYWENEEKPNGMTLQILKHDPNCKGCAAYKKMRREAEKKKD